MLVIPVADPAEVSAEEPVTFRLHPLSAAYIIVGGVLGAVAILLVPGLFEEFRPGRLATILGLMVGVAVFAVAAKRNREQMTQ